MKIGFIGAGNMAKAMMKGIIASQIVRADEIFASDAFLPALEKVKNEFGINITQDNKEIAKECNIVFLAIKPQFYNTVIEEIKSCIKENSIIISIAPGQTLKSLEERFGRELKIVRTMPNTPAMVCEGMTAICKNKFVTEEEIQFVVKIIEAFGKAAIVNECMMDAVVAASGSAPAYVYLFIEAIADGAVMEGMPRDLAYKFAAQTVLGSAKMVLETGMHPGALKDMVCSPAGTTIEAIRVLEKEGFRSSVIEAMKACVNKARSLK